MPAERTATFAGIRNENEFYSNHYLTEILSGDIRETVTRWREAAADGNEGTRAPYDALRALSRDYVQVRRRVERERRHDARLRHQRDWFRQLLGVLGYGWGPGNHGLESGVEVPILGSEGSTVGAPQLLVLGAYDAEGEGDDPLALPLHSLQFHGEAPPDTELLRESWNDVVTRRIFAQDRPPRWLLLLSHNQVLLIERGKWTHNRLLRFDLDEILGRRDEATLKATAALLYRDCLLPADGRSLLDTLDENSHKHAVGVSEDLKYALRESIELIANEAIRYLREVLKDRIYALDDALAGELGLECLRYMYRLLFLFYIEARPDLGYVPIDSEAYRKGYSLEHLRDLEMVRLTTDESLNGYYLHDSIRMLFRLIRDGFRDDAADSTGDLFAKRGIGFRIDALDSALFRAGSTPLLDRVKLRNSTLQQVIRLMSLSRPARGRRGRRGRISYAQLGINQLGAAYEALLSYRGFFAEEDLYEVKKASDEPDELQSAWFVPVSELEQYREEERVYDRDENGRRKLRVHLRGRFIYRLAGRDRQKSASYYTPESLTRSVVKYALGELIPDDMPAVRILDLTVCEPAMGSAAFLNEAVNQLAERYLERRQREMGKRIPHAEYADELQRVRHYIADRNVYGVDLNPVAVELAEVSLWLNCIRPGGHVPWFGYQLVCGNSLVGARRQVFPAVRLGAENSKAELWFNQAPERVAQSAEREIHRRPGTVYHFLLPDPGMADYRNKTAKALEPDNFERIKAWRKAFCKPFSDEEIAELEALSDRVDKLWAAHTEQLTRDHQATEDTLSVWGGSKAEGERRTGNEWKDRIRAQGVYSEGTRTASPYRRLKLVMDYWCALWFWPIRRAGELPHRDEFLNEVSLVLTGSVFQPDLGPNQTAQLFGPEYARHAADIAKRITDEIGMLDLDRLAGEFPRLKLVEELARRHRYHHWELAFADIFYGQDSAGGFDMVLGNPPWVKVEWEERAVLGDYDPLVVLRGHPPSELAKIRDSTFARHQRLRDLWIDELEQAEGAQAFLNSGQNFPLLAGQKVNLFKCFLPQVWMIGSERGVVGLLHPEGVYDDPKGRPLRAALYPRLRIHFQFQNEKKLFPVDHHTLFSINVYGTASMLPEFSHISNLYVPSTIDACFDHDGRGTVPGVKDETGNWNIAGHRHRVISVDESSLTMFAELYDEPDVPAAEARLPALHSRELLTVLEKLATCPRHLNDLQGNFTSLRIGTRRYPRRMEPFAVRRVFLGNSESGSCPDLTILWATHFTKSRGESAC